MNNCSDSSLWPSPYLSLSPITCSTASSWQRLLIHSLIRHIILIFLFVWRSFMKLFKNLVSSHNINAFLLPRLDQFYLINGHVHLFSFCFVEKLLSIPPLLSILSFYLVEYDIINRITVTIDGLWIKFLQILFFISRILRIFQRLNILVR